MLCQEPIAAMAIMATFTKVRLNELTVFINVLFELLIYLHRKDYNLQGSFLTRHSL